MNGNIHVCRLNPFCHFFIAQLRATLHGGATQALGGILLSLLALMAWIDCC